MGQYVLYGVKLVPVGHDPLLCEKCNEPVDDPCNSIPGVNRVGKRYCKKRRKNSLYSPIELLARMCAVVVGYSV